MRAFQFRCRNSLGRTGGWLVILVALAAAEMTPMATAHADEIQRNWRVAAAIEPRGDEPSETGSVDAGEPSVPKSELQTIGVRAELKATRTGAPAPAGGTAFATILLTNETSAKSVAAEIELKTEGSEIKAVTGGVEKAGETPSSRVIAVPDIGRKKPERVTVELLLKEGAATEAQKANRLRITLRQPGGEAADSTEFSWRVIDCPGAYYSRLTEIRDQSDTAIGDLLKSVQKPDRERPGRWLFTPSASSSKQRCLKSERVYDRRSGRRYYRCVEFSQPEVAGLDPEMTMLEREVVRFAAPLVSRRTVDPELSVKRNTGWVSYKIGTDLRTYLSQPKSPALCTGVPAFIGYYEGKLGDVSKRIEMFVEKADEAKKVAHARVLLARDIAAGSAGGHPGWGGAALSLSAPEADAGLQQLVVAVAAITGDTALQEDASAADGAFDALERFKDFFKDKTDADLPKDVSAAIASALAAIEAADYIAAAAEPYSAIDRHIVGSLAAISRAHADNCACGQ